MNQFTNFHYGEPRATSSCFWGDKQSETVDDLVFSKQKVFDQIINDTLNKSAEELFGVFDDDVPQKPNTDIIDRLDKIIELLQILTNREAK